MMKATVLAAILVTLLDCVCGDYELRARFHSYRNPTSSRNNGRVVTCCDDSVITTCQDNELCDNFFIVCAREFGLMLSSIGNCMTTATRTETFTDNDNIDFSEHRLTVTVQVPGNTEGIQFYAEVMDDDFGVSNNDRIDRFAVDLSSSALSQVGTQFSNATVLNGVQGFGQLEVSFQVLCAENFFGADCATQCVPDSRMICDEEGNGVCRLGWDGPDCTLVDACLTSRSACGPNGECLNTVDGLFCECNLGFNGMFCEVEMSSSLSQGTTVIRTTTVVPDTTTTTVVPDTTTTVVPSSVNKAVVIGAVLGGLLFLALVLIIVITIMVIMLKRRGGSPESAAAQASVNVYKSGRGLPTAGVAPSDHTRRPLRKQPSPGKPTEIIPMQKNEVYGMTPSLPDSSNIHTHHPNRKQPSPGKPIEIIPMQKNEVYGMTQSLTDSENTYDYVVV